MKPVVELLRNRAPGIYQVAPDVLIFEGLRLLAEYEVGAMVVMENDQLVGVLSERDYTRKVALQGRNSRDTCIGDIMTREVVTVTPQTSTHTCMALMSQNKIRHLPVVQEGKVLGMISMRDIMDDIIADQEQTISQLQQYIST